MISTTELEGFLPHTGKMVWIDQVISPGVCLVIADQKKHYFSGDFVRQSAYIEWIAQSYGFSGAYEQYLQGTKTSLSKSFLVSFNKAVFSEENIKDQEEVIIEVSLIKEMEQLSVVSGRIYSKEKNIIYCEASVKLYSE